MIEILRVALTSIRGNLFRAALTMLGVLKALKHLAVDTDKSIGELLEEAIAQLLQKYCKPNK